jgi:glycosyltransferase involved in cell wall biosynthesis
MQPTLTVLIRFSNSSVTLPAVLASLKSQTFQPDTILGIDNNSRDGSRDLMHTFGAEILDWPSRYHHSKVLNHGLSYCKTDTVLVLSSHSRLADPLTLEALVHALRDPDTVAASLPYPGDSPGPVPDKVVWRDLVRHGLPFGSIYTNSCGLLRRSAWLEHPFNENVRIAEDYVWALWHVSRGGNVDRVRLPYEYLRRGRTRYFTCVRHVCALASTYGLNFTEASLRWSAARCHEGFVRAVSRPAEWKTGYAIARQGSECLLARLTWPLLMPTLRRDRLQDSQLSRSDFRL